MGNTQYEAGRPIHNTIEVDGASFAEQVIFKTYGDVVSIEKKGKTLNKFGRNLAVGNSYETIAEFQSTTANESFVTTNLVDSIVSSSTSDTTQTITIEGHTVDAAGNMTFVIQDAVLAGQTPVTLTTPLARATRISVKSSGTFGTTPAALVGVVSVYDNTDGQTSGVPTTAAATKILIQSGETQSAKCSTTISSNDYWLINTFTAGVGNSGGSAARITFRMEARDIKNGGAWKPLGGELVIPADLGSSEIMYIAPLIIPKNHDWRVVAKTNANTAEVFAEALGVLAAIV